MNQHKAYIFLNGKYEGEIPLQMLPKTGDQIIAVDGGVRMLHKLKLVPSILIGDLDSVSPSDLEWCRNSGIDIKQYPKEKDETDFELALAYAQSQTEGDLIIHGALGGRIDHTLANLALISGAGPDREIQIIGKGKILFFIHDKMEIRGKAGQKVSLIPWGGLAEGVTTTGLQYPLKNEVLFPTRSRGISNVLTTNKAIIEVQKGLLLCVKEM